MPINSVVVENVRLLPRTSAKISANLLVLEPYAVSAQVFSSSRAVHVENVSRVQAWRGNLLVLGTGPNPFNADIFIGQDSYGWPLESFEPPTFAQNWKFNAVVRDSFTTYVVARDRRAKQSVMFFEPETFIKPWSASQAIINTFTPYVPGHDVRRARQGYYFQEPESYAKSASFNELIINGSAPPIIPILPPFMPNVVGLYYYPAVAICVKAGLHPTAPLLTNVSGYRNGYVISQSIPAGNHIDKGMAVTLTVKSPTGKQFLAESVGDIIPYWYFQQ